MKAAATCDARGSRGSWLVCSQSRTLNLEHPVYVTQSPIWMSQAFYWFIWIYVHSVFGRTTPTRCDVVFMLNLDCKHVFIVEYSSFGNITSSSFFHYGASTRQPVCFPIQCSVGSERKGKERKGSVSEVWNLITLSYRIFRLFE